MFPYGKKHSDCVHYKDGFCDLYKTNIDPNSPICPNFTPKKGISSTGPPQGYFPPTVSPYPQYYPLYPYYSFPFQYYWEYPQMMWNPLYSLWYLQMYFNPLLSYYLMSPWYSWLLPFWFSSWYSPWYWFYLL